MLLRFNLGVGGGGDRRFGWRAAPYIPCSPNHKPRQLTGVSQARCPVTPSVPWRLRNVKASAIVRPYIYVGSPRDRSPAYVLGNENHENAADYRLVFHHEVFADGGGSHATTFQPAVVALQREAAGAGLGVG